MNGKAIDRLILEEIIFVRKATGYFTDSVMEMLNNKDNSLDDSLVKRLQEMLKRLNRLDEEVMEYYK